MTWTKRKLLWPLVILPAILHWPQAAKSQQMANGRVFDLTHTFDASTIYWPTEEGFKLLPGPAEVTDGGYFYVANRFICAEHGGTHVDAPIHFFEKGQTVENIPLERLVGSGACVDVSQKCASDRDYQATVEDFQAWEAANKASLENRIVLIRTGFGRYWPDREKYLGTREQGKAAVAKLHFPGLDPSAADWLVTRRRIRMVGIDTASIDHGQTQNYPTHRRLFRDNVPSLENVAEIDKLPADGFRIIALPMKIGGGSGAPCRIVAIVEATHKAEKQELGKLPASESVSVYVTALGKRYHRENCRFLNASKRAIDLATAKRTHTPCKECRPPQ